ncbi:MAG TPA: hypothetical protein VNP36_14325, partial [Burkholderiales bacterium]|nr:hypothetical protein [Burkholderiales bacterium]
RTANQAEGDYPKQGAYRKESFSGEAKMWAQGLGIWNSRPGVPGWGKASIGGSWTGIGANVKRCTIYTSTFTGTVSKLTAYLDGNGTGTGNQVMKAVIYTAPLGTPDALISTSAEVTVVKGSPAAWRDFPFSSPPSVTSGTLYCLGIHSGSANQSARYAHDTAADSLKWNSGDTYSDGPASPFGTPTIGSKDMSIYASP